MRGTPLPSLPHPDLRQERCRIDPAPADILGSFLVSACAHGPGGTYSLKDKLANLLCNWGRLIMRIRSARLLALTALAGAAVLLAGCSGIAAPAPAAPTAAPSPSASALPAPAALSAPAGTWSVGAGSKATVRVREQLVGVSAPSDAVLVGSGVKGSFLLNENGTFSPDSKITFDLATLASDNRNRDDFVKRTTLGLAQFPVATLVPLRATGLPLPLPAAGDFRFRLTGKLTIHGVTKEMTFDVAAKRSGSDLTATATATPPLTFKDFGMSAPSAPLRVVSVVDEIQLVVDLVATGPAN